MTLDEANALIARATGDHVFRQKLLMEPQLAAAELNIRFSENDVDEFVRSTNSARNKCIEIDSLRDHDRRMLVLFKVAAGPKLQ